MAPRIVVSQQPADREKMIQEAEELLGQTRVRSFAKRLFFGEFESNIAFPYPTPSPKEKSKLQGFLGEVVDFLDKKVDSPAIDREAEVPDSVIQGLFKLGVMSMSIPPEHGGLGFSQFAYCRVMEEVGKVDSSVGILVNAHQSIGLKSLLLFGSPEQKKEWLPKLASGKVLAAFALTEPNAGSDAGGIETRAILNPEGTHYILNGRKQWITNGGAAGLLTVMAKVPNTADEKGRERITAFLVTPDMKGFEVEVKALEKCGIRGTMTSKLVFRDIQVPIQNVIGKPGKGLRLALTVLDFGRTTFGATCTGLAKRCLHDATEHAKSRHQFGRALGQFELVKKKLAEMAALTFAMEAGTYLTAGLIDRGLEDYMIETAMLKVFASESLWFIVNETIQIFGGKAYFTDLPYERMLRDARINMIGEGANDVLRTFIALAGMRDVGYELKGVLEALKAPLGNMGKLGQFAVDHLPGGKRVRVPVHARLEEPGLRLEKLVSIFGRSVEGALIRHGEEILEKQYVQAKIADSAMELYMMSAILSRLDALLGSGDPSDSNVEKNFSTGLYYCRTAERRIRGNLKNLNDELDPETTAVADSLLE